MALFHSANGSVNYTVVGNPTIVDGVVSDFSDNQYIYTNGTLDCSKNFEIVVAATTGTGIDVPEVPRTLFRNEYNGVGNTGFTITIQERKLKSWILNSTGGWLSQGVVGINSFSDNTDYLFKLSQKKTYGSIYAIELNSSADNGTTWRLENSWTSTYPIRTSVGCAFGGGASTPGQYWTGSIDLTRTYITVDGQLWFGGLPIEVKKHQIMGPVGYTNVGGLTITDGVANGFSKNKYLSLGNFPQNVADLEIQIKFKTGSAADTDNWQGLFSVCSSESGHNLIIRYSRSSKQISFSPNFTYETGNWILTSNTLEYETWYTYKISKVGNVYTLYKNGVAEATATSSVTIEPNNLATRLGYAAVYSGNTVGGFNSSIDLNETYIKVNGKLWFYQPAPTKYIVKDGKLVWADPDLYLQSDGNQYIDTDYVPVENDALSSSVLYPTTPSTNMAIFSAGTGSYQLVMICNYSQAYIRYFNNSAVEISKSQTANNWYDFSAENGTSTYAGVSGSTPYLAALDGNDTTLRIFKRKNDASPLIGSLKAFVIKNGGTVKRHFVPVPQGLVIGNYTVPSNGMFDIVTQTFYGNAGTGTFTIGRDE